MPGNCKMLIPRSAMASARKYVENPATGDILCSVPDMGAVEMADAVEKAAEAQLSWAACTPNERATVIRDWAQALRKNQEALASLITAENGKPLADARVEVSTGVAALEWYAEEAKRSLGYVVPSVYSTNRRQLISHRPVGVVGVITPWNFPLSMITRKAGAALAAGCGVVLKPAEATPLTALAITQLAVEAAGMPGPLISCLTTGSRAGAAQMATVMCEHPAVRLVAFTGSTAVGKTLYGMASKHGKRVLLELGGNAPFIVFAGADLQKSVAGAVASKFRCSGQTCISANRIYVEESIYDRFVKALTEAVSRLVVDEGTQPGVQVGPLINAAAVNKVHGLVSSDLASGARATVGGESSSSARQVRGSFYPPTVLVDMRQEMACMQQEIFGPVAPVCKFHSEAEAIQLANDTGYGLAGYLYTEDIGQAWRVSESLRFGMIGINTPRISTVELPFGGVKDSGMGREGGPHALQEFQDVTTTCWEI